MPVMHELKTWPEPFQALVDGKKTFEIRQDDRGGFYVGDILKLEEYVPPPKDDPGVGKYTGRWLTRKVSYIARGWGLPDGMVVMGLAAVDSVGAEPCENCHNTGVVSHSDPEDDEECPHPRPSDARTYLTPVGFNKCVKHNTFPDHDEPCWGCEREAMEHRTKEAQPEDGARCHHCGHYETRYKHAVETYAHCRSCGRHTRWERVPCTNEALLNPGDQVRLISAPVCIGVVDGWVSATKVRVAWAGQAGHRTEVEASTLELAAPVTAMMRRMGRALDALPDETPRPDSAKARPIEERISEKAREWLRANGLRSEHRLAKLVELLGEVNDEALFAGICSHPRPEPPVSEKCALLCDACKALPESESASEGICHWCLIRHDSYGNRVMREALYKIYRGDAPAYVIAREALDAALEGPKGPRTETPSVVRNFRCGHCGERVTEHRLVSNCGGCGEDWRAVVTGGEGT